MNPTKFGSPQLDIPSSSYKFLKFAYKFVKINQEKHFKYWLTAGTRGSTGPTCQRHTKQGRGLTGEKLIDSKVTGDEVGTNVFPILLCTYTNPWFAQRIIGASSAVVRSGAPAIPSDSMVRREWLWHLQTLAKLFGMD